MYVYIYIVLYTCFSVHVSFLSATFSPPSGCNSWANSSTCGRPDFCLRRSMDDAHEANVESCFGKGCLSGLPPEADLVLICSSHQGAQKKAFPWESDCEDEEYKAGWWFGTSILFSHILGMSSSQLTFIFFRGVAQPPTRRSIGGHFTPSVAYFGPILQPVHAVLGPSTEDEASKSAGPAARACTKCWKCCKCRNLFSEPDMAVVNSMVYGCLWSINK